MDGGGRVQRLRAAAAARSFARTARLIARIRHAAAAIGALELVTDKSRREWKLSDGAAAKAVLDLKPAAYWRLNEFTGPVAADASAHDHDAVYERDIAYYLQGPKSSHGVTV